MKVFVSWSGPISKTFALQLADWLPLAVSPEIDAFVSAEDIAKGSRGFDVIARELQDSQFGLICLTAANFEKPWINFEAGALSKQVATSKVVPILLDLTSETVQGPLKQFQHVNPDKADFFALIQMMNTSLERQLTGSQLEKSFDRWWPDMAASLKAAAAASPTTEPGKTSIVDWTVDRVEAMLGTAVRAALEATLPELTGNLSEVERAQVLATAVEAANDEYLGGIIRIDLRELRESADVLQLAWDPAAKISTFLNTIYYAIEDEVDAFTYGSSWILIDSESGREIRNIGTTWASVHGTNWDTRPVESVGILPGMLLKAHLLPPEISTNSEHGSTT